MIPINKTVLIIGTIILVVVLYQYIGEAAIGGLLALFLGSKKGNQQKIAETKVERDEHGLSMEQAKGQVVNDNIKAAESHKQAQATADDITQPNEPVKDGYTRRTFGTRAK